MTARCNVSPSCGNHRRIKSHKLRGLVAFGVMVVIAIVFAAVFPVIVVSWGHDFAELLGGNAP